MKILNRHVGRTILRHTMVSMAVLLVLFAVVEFIEEIGNDDYSFSQVSLLVLLSVPRMVYELFPMAALLGTTVGLSVLAVDSELVVMRATGVSIAGITMAALRMGALFVIAAMLIGEFVTPVTERQAQRVRAGALQQDIQQKRDFGLWIRDAQTFVNIGEVLPDLTLLGIRIFTFDDERRLRSMVAAGEGVYADDHWRISDVRQTRIGPEGDVEATAAESDRWQTRVTPRVLSVFLVRPEQLSFWQVRHYIRHLAANQQQTEPFELAYWGKLMLPLSTALMVLLAIPFVFVNIRSGGVGRSLFIGIMLGLGFYAVNQGLGYVVLANGISPFLGATVPVAGFLLLAMVMMRRIG